MLKVDLQVFNFLNFFSLKIHLFDRYLVLYYDVTDVIDLFYVLEFRENIKEAPKNFVLMHISNSFSLSHSMPIIKKIVHRPVT